MFHNQILDYTLMVLKFNHEYPILPYDDYKDPYTVQNHLKNFLNYIYQEEFLNLPSEIIDISQKVSSPDFNDIEGFYELYYLNYLSVQDKLSYCKGISDNLAQKLSSNFSKYVNEVQDLDLIEKIKLIYNAKDKILYPREHNLLEGYDEELLIYSDIIRAIYRNDIIVGYNNYNGELYADLNEYFVWEEFISHSLHFSDDVNKIFIVNNHTEVNNIFELLIMIVLFKRLEAIKENFVQILMKARKELENSNSMNDSQLIQYIIDYYKEIISSKDEKLCILKGVKLNKKISNLFTKVLIKFLEIKKLEYDKKLHENYTFNPNISDIEFDNLKGTTKIPIRKNDNDTYLDKPSTYILMNLLKDENVFLDEVNATLLYKATEALTGYKHNQLRKYDSKDKKHELNKKEHYQKLEQLLKSMLRKVREFKNNI